MSALTDAWQRALGAEEQAVFGYPLAGPHFDTDTGNLLARADQSAHEALRDEAAAGVSGAGGAAQPPPADYPALYPVPDPASAQRLAIRLEDDAAAAWRYLYSVAATVPGPRSAATRATAQAALTASAVRATQWRAQLDPAEATVAFPGI
jgi:Domain of unknown function (DUF4439)